MEYVDTSRILKGKLAPGDKRVEGRVPLPNVKVCSCCNTRHEISQHVAIFTIDGEVWFHCECGSTLFIPAHRALSAA